MKFIEVLICAALLAFMSGLFYATQANPMAPEKVELPTIVTKDLPTFGDTPATTGLKPCSEVETMPCTDSPRNPLKERLDNHKQREGLFYKGERVTCIYPAIMVTHWSGGVDDEYVKTEGIKCKVIKASEAFDDLAPGYQHIQVDCTDGLKDLYNLSATSKLNYKQRWMTSDECYHFVEGGK